MAFVSKDTTRPTMTMVCSLMHSTLKDIQIVHWVFRHWSIVLAVTIKYLVFVLKSKKIIQPPVPFENLYALMAYRIPEWFLIHFRAKVIFVLFISMPTKVGANKHNKLQMQHGRRSHKMSCQAWVNI